VSKCVRRSGHSHWVTELLLFASDGLAVAIAHCRGIVAISLEIGAEPSILESNGILRKGQHINMVLYM
jgi:hypothetical protein